MDKQCFEPRRIPQDAKCNVGAEFRLDVLFHCPVPVRFALTVPPPLMETFSLALRVPLFVGSKVMLSEQLVPAGSELPQVLVGIA